MQDGFCVGVRFKHMTCGNKLFAQFLVIVNFTIEHNYFAAIFVQNRLAPAFKVNNRKAAMHQSNVFVYIIASIIGPTVSNALAHELGNFRWVFNKVGTSKTGKSTHSLSFVLHK